MDLRSREPESPLATTVLQAPTSRTKYRGLARASRGYQPATPAHVRNLLAHFGVRRITIGHTLVERVGLGHDGRVLRLDVHHAGGVSEGVLLEDRSEEHTSELQSLMRISYAVFCLKKKKN